MSQKPDIRKFADRSVAVEGGMLYQLGIVVQVFWDDGSRETWTAPDKAQASSEFDDMAERWQHGN